MKKFLLLILICLLGVPFLGCGYNYQENGIYAEIITNKGKMIFKLEDEKTPITVGNFVGLAEGQIDFLDSKTEEHVKRPFYDGLIFHRIIQDFVIQGGCPNGRGDGGPGYEFVNECSPDLKHDQAGILSMANSGPDTNGSQFFITLKPTPHLDGLHTVFGHLIDGEKTMRKIAAVKKDQRDKPLKDVVIKKIKIVRIGQKAKSFNAVHALAQNEVVLLERQRATNKIITETLKKKGLNYPKFITTPTGLRYQILRQGYGQTVKSGQTVLIKFKIYNIDGTLVDDSNHYKEDFSFVAGGQTTLPAWEESILKMKQGEKRLLVAPANLAFGQRGAPPLIKPGATLIFELELRKIK